MIDTKTIRNEPFVSHIYGPQFAVPAVDITNCNKERTFTIEKKTKKVSFPSRKFLTELRYIKCRNKGKRHVDIPNLGDSVNIDWTSEQVVQQRELSNAIALAKAKLIRKREDTDEYMRQEDRAYFMEGCILYWESDQCYIVNLLPLTAVTYPSIPLDHIPSVSRKKGIHHCIRNPFVHWHFGNVPDWLNDMGQYNIPIMMLREQLEIGPAPYYDAQRPEWESIKFIHKD